MKLLSIDPFIFNKGLKFFDIKSDLFILPYFFDIEKFETDKKNKKDNHIAEYLHEELKRFINNDFDDSLIDKIESIKLGHLLLILEYYASINEHKYNPYFEAQYNFDIINTFAEEIRISDFFKFFVIVLNSLTLSYDDSSLYLGKLDKLSNKDKFKRKELTIIQKYVIIARLLSIFLHEINIKSKTSFNIAFHFIIIKFIDKTIAEADFLNNNAKDGILINRGSIFLKRDKFRTPVSQDEIQNIYYNIKKLFEDTGPLEEFYQIKANERFLESKKPPNVRSNKIWSKSFFIKNIKKYKNQSEMAKALGVSRQRISAMKKKLNIHKFLST